MVGIAYNSWNYPSQINVNIQYTYSAVTLVNFQ